MMDNYSTERTLAFLYFLSAILSIIEFTALLTPWLHWSEILDTCPQYRCNCILYGSSGFSFFSGGKNVLCRFATYASLPVILISSGFTVYHGYRSCILSRRNKRNQNSGYRRGRTREEGEQTENNLGGKLWYLWTGLSILVVILLFSNAVIVTDGYYKTCDQYRRTLVKSLVATGNSAKVIYDRLQCGAVFDFMDYMEPFTRPFFVKDESRLRPTDPRRDFYRGQMINTGATLQLAIVCLWFNFATWLIVSIIYCIIVKWCKCCKCCSCCRST